MKFFTAVALLAAAVSAAPTKADDGGAGGMPLCAMQCIQTSLAKCKTDPSACQDQDKMKQEISQCVMTSCMPGGGMPGGGIPGSGGSGGSGGIPGIGGGVPGAPGS